MTQRNPNWEPRIPFGGTRSASSDSSLSAAVMRRVWLLETLHRVTSSITRQDDVENSLPEIARVIFEEFGLVSVGIGVLEDGWIHYRGVASRVASLRNRVPVSGYGGESRPIVEPNPFGGERPASPSLSDSDAIERSAKVPIRVSGDIYGVLSVAVSVDSRLSGEELEVLEQIAAALGAGIEQSRRRNEQLRTVEHLTQLQKLLGRIRDRLEPRDGGGDVLSDIATTFGYSQVRLGTITHCDLRLHDTYRNAFLDRSPADTLPISRGISGRAARSGRTQLVRDVRSDPDYVPHRESTEAVICTPLWSVDEVIGVLWVASDVAGGLSDHDVEIVSILADHFSLVLSNRLRLEALDRRAEQLRILERVTSTIGRMIPTRASIADVVGELRQSWGFASSIGLIEGGRLMFHGIEQGLPVPPPSWLREGLPLDRGITGRVARTGEAEFVREVHADPDYLDIGADTGSEIAVPIKVEGRVIGVLNVEAPKAQSFHDEDYEILTIIANHLGIALANYNIFSSEQDTRKALEAVQRVSTIVSGTLDPDEALRLIAETLAAVLSYPVVAVELIGGDHLRLAASFGFPESAHRHEGMTESIAGRVALSGEAEFLPAIEGDSSAYPYRDDMVSGIYAPIRRGSELFGVLTVQGTDEHPLTEWDLTLLRTFAENAGVLLNNARVYDEMRRTAALDSITGVPNHRHFQERLRQEVDRARKSDSELSLLVVDIDTFKEFNDRFGHIEGDRILSEIASRLQGQLRDQDLLARYAGDEFVVILPDVTSRVSLEIAARLLRAVRSRPFELPNGDTTVITLSIGAATFPADASSDEELISAADTAMYLAKGYGRDAVCHFRDIALLDSGNALPVGNGRD